MGKIHRLQVNNIGKCKLLSCRGMFTPLAEWIIDSSQGKREQERWTEVRSSGMLHGEDGILSKSWKRNGFFVVNISKITADGDCSHEIKRRILLGRKVMTNLDSILKSRDITLPTKVHLAKARFSQWSRMDVRVGLWRKLSAEKLMLLNCGVGEDSWESLGLQGDPTSPS